MKLIIVFTGAGGMTCNNKLFIVLISLILCSCSRPNSTDVFTCRKTADENYTCKVKLSENTTVETIALSTLSFENGQLHAGHWIFLENDWTIQFSQEPNSNPDYKNEDVIAIDYPLTGTTLGGESLEGKIAHFQFYNIPVNIDFTFIPDPLMIELTPGDHIIRLDEYRMTSSEEEVLHDWTKYQGEDGGAIVLRVNFHNDSIKQ